MSDEQKRDYLEAIRDKSPVVTDAETLAVALSNIGTMSPRLRKVYDDSAALLRAQKAAIDAAVASERELWQKDAARLDWLETLLHRTEYQNSRRPAESVSSDMHFAHGKCNLYVRNLFGNAITGAGGSGDSVRAAIDAAIRQAGEKT